MLGAPRPNWAHLDDDACGAVGLPATARTDPTPTPAPVRDQTCTLPTIRATAPPTDQMQTTAANVTPPSMARFRFTEPESRVALSHQALAVTQKPPEEGPDWNPPRGLIDLPCFTLRHGFA